MSLFITGLHSMHFFAHDDIIHFALDAWRQRFFINVENVTISQRCFLSKRAPKRVWQVTVSRPRGGEMVKGINFRPALLSVSVVCFPVESEWQTTSLKVFRIRPAKRRSGRTNGVVQKLIQCRSMHRLSLQINSHDDSPQKYLSRPEVLALFIPVNPCKVYVIRGLQPNL